MPLSDEEWGFDAAIEQEESFLQDEEFLPPEAEELGLVQTAHAPALPILPADEVPAEPEAEPATEEPPHSAVLPQSEVDTVSLSPCVPRRRLRSKTTAPLDSPFNVKPTPPGVEAKSSGEPVAPGGLSWWRDMD